MKRSRRSRSRPSRARKARTGAFWTHPDLPWFLGVLCVGMFLRFYSLGQAPHTYWVDMAGETVDARNIAELGMHRLIFPLGTREPFFSYLMAGLWTLLPDVSGVLIQRLGAGLVDLATLVVLYFFGKDLWGGRTGLFLCAFGAVCRPMVLQCVLGMRVSTTVLGIVLALWATFRTVRDPQVGRFLLWGLAVAFNGYTYTAARPWIPFLGLGLLGWVVLRRGQKVAPALFLAVLSGLWATAYFLWKNNQWPPGWAPYFPGPSWVGPLLLTLGLAWEGTQTYQERKATPLLGWLLGLFLIGILQYPLLHHHLYTVRFLGLELFGEGTGLGTRILMLLHQLRTTLEALLLGGHDRMDLNLFGRAFLDPWTLAGVALGLGFVTVRPTVVSWLLLLAVAVGLSPHVFSKDPHSAKLMGCLVPLLCLSALALEASFQALRHRLPERGLAVVLGLLFLGSAGACFRDVWEEFPKQYMPDRVAAGEAARSAEKDPVFLGMDQGSGFLYAITESVLNDEKDIRQLSGTNTLYRTGEEGSGNVVFIFPKGVNPSFEERLKGEYPSVAWEPLPWPQDSRPECRPEPGTSPFWRVTVPLSLIGSTPGNVLSLVKTLPGGWLRKIYQEPYGLAHGVLSYEDRTEVLDAPIPQDSGNRTARLTSELRLEREQERTFSLISPNPVVLKVDGRKVLRLREAGQGERVLRLSEGLHHLELLTHLRDEVKMPSLQVR